MLLLTIDTSTSYVVAGLVDLSPAGARARATRATDNARGHMELLVPQIQDCLADAGIVPDDIDAVVVGVGPGPFTGLRVGVATAIAYGQALGVPVHGVSSLAAQALAAVRHPTAEEGDSHALAAEGESTVIAVSDARRREWFSAAVAITPSPTAPRVRMLDGWPLVASAEATAERIAALPEPPHGVALTSAVTASLDRLSAPLPAPQLADDAWPDPEALALLALSDAGGDLPALLSDPAEPVQPLYLRRPDAVEPKRKPVSSAIDFSAVTPIAAEADADAPSDSPDAPADSAPESATAPTPAPAAVDSTVSLRPAGLGAAARLAAIDACLFKDDSPWSENGFRFEITHPSVLGFLLVDESRTAGEAGVSEQPAEEPLIIGYAFYAALGGDAPGTRDWEVRNIGIDPAYQGRGYAHLLFAPLIGLAAQDDAPCVLEVRTDNDPAVGLYRSYGFDIAGVRRGYYQPSGADAYTMVRPAPSALTSANTSLTDAGSAADPSRPLVVLGIESSCDETGVGIVELHRDQPPAGSNPEDTPAPRVVEVCNHIASSMEQHARFGGVVPEIASRAHVEALRPTMDAALDSLREAYPHLDRPDVVAATIGPGLAGALLVGAAAAKAYAAAWGVPFYAVNHLGGHVAVDSVLDATPASTSTDPDPATHATTHAVALLVSGGHTQLLEVTGIGRPMRELGSTVDDAAGEAYDKVARLLGLGYPGGPVIDRLAAQGNPQAIRFPRGMMRQQDAPYDFSFSGLKTAVARYVEQAERAGETLPIEDVCASFQEAVCDVLTHKALRACRDTGARTLILGGGVSANSRLRDLARRRCASDGIALRIPRPALCTDNGIMIAALAAHLIAAGASPSSLSTATDPSLDVDTPQLSD